MLVFVFFAEVHGQYRRTRIYRPNIAMEQPGIGVSIGFLNARCDMGSHDIPVSTFGAEAGVSWRFRDHYGVSVNAMLGKLGDRFNYPYKQYDWISDIAEFSVRGQLHLEKLFEIESYNILPYIGTGAGIVIFKSYGNKFDQNGEPYFFWRDGTVRTESEWNFDWQTVDFLLRDNNYETLLNQFDQYNNYAFVLLLEGGAKIKLTDHWLLKAGTKYTFTFTDYIDHDLGYRDEALQIRSPENTDNDGYFFTSVGIIYSFGDTKNRRMIRPSRRRY